MLLFLDQKFCKTMNFLSKVMLITKDRTHNFLFIGKTSWSCNNILVISHLIFNDSFLFKATKTMQFNKLSNKKFVKKQVGLFRVNQLKLKILIKIK
jgi:hypothetical protein